MADDIDKITAMDEFRLSRTPKRVQFKEIPFSGSCLCCQEPVSNRRFCSPECREEHEFQAKRSKTIKLHTRTSTQVR